MTSTTKIVNNSVQVLHHGQKVGSWCKSNSYVVRSAKVVKCTTLPAKTCPRCGRATQLQVQVTVEIVAEWKYGWGTTIHTLTEEINGTVTTDLYRKQHPLCQECGEFNLVGPIYQVFPKQLSRQIEKAFLSMNIPFLGWESLNNGFQLRITEDTEPESALKAFG
jgi:hypothetical protein